MANVRSGNVLYIDTASSAYSQKGLKAAYIVVTATSANAVVVLQDSGTSANMLPLRVAVSGSSQTFDFSASPVHFPNGVVASTLTNGVAALILV